MFRIFQAESLFIENLWKISVTDVKVLQAQSLLGDWI